MERLILVRHGQSEHHLNGMTGGWTDLPLTELGQNQAAFTAERLGSMLGDAEVSVYSSDLRRASMTAAPIARQLGVPLIQDPRLRELNNGSAAGLTQREAKALELPRTGSLFDWQHYPGAETWRGMTARVSDYMNGLGSSSAATAIVVSHAAACTAVVRWWLGVLDLDAHPIMFEFDPCSITELGRSPWGEPTISRLNDVSHLAPW
jgi:probable phosphoglycerate mutase